MFQVLVGLVQLWYSNCELLCRFYLLCIPFAWIVCIKSYCFETQLCISNSKMPVDCVLKSYSFETLHCIPKYRVYEKVAHNMLMWQSLIGNWKTSNLFICQWKTVTETCCVCCYVPRPPLHYAEYVANETLSHRHVVQNVLSVVVFLDRLYGLLNTTPQQACLPASVYSPYSLIPF